MKDYLLDVMQQQEHGLYLCELPTGNGKTFDSAQAMKEYADSIGDDTKIIYLTTLNKNLPEDALRAAYGSEELYKRNVLRLRSNFDEVVEKILEIEVPEEMKTDAYLKLCKDVSLYRNAVDKRYADKEYIKELADRITEGDRQLRYEITKRLKNKFQTKTQRKKAIRTDAKYKWIGKLYPAVFTDDYKIILMSVSKFMKRNSILIDSSYEFLNSDLIENAVIVIDEFDATKDTIQSELIEKSLAMQEDYIQLFRQIYRTLNPNDFSSSMRQAMDKVEKSGNRNTFTTLMDEARKIAENYHVRLSIKTKEDLVNQRQIFLFNDGSFHTVLEEGAQYIRSSLNKEDNRIDVFFEGKDDFFKNRNKEKDIVLYSRHCIREDILEEIVLGELQGYINSMCDCEKVLEHLDRLNINYDEAVAHDKEIAMLKEELTKCSVFKSSLYQDLQEEIISKEQFTRYRDEFSARKRALEQAIKEQEEIIRSIYENGIVVAKDLEQFRENLVIGKLDRMALVSFIDRILIYDDFKVEIVFKYRQEMEKVAGLIQVANEAVLEPDYTMVNGVPVLELKEAV